MTAQATTYRPPTGPMLRYLRVLLAERDPEHRSIPEGADYDLVSRGIDYWKRQPKLAAATTHQPDSMAPEVNVPAGRYATENADGILRFYKVDRPEEGRWAGYTFVKVMASDEEHPIRNREERNRILAAIAVDPRAALVRYGREIGRCGRCGRTLTDPDSIAAGIGPICATQGW